MNRVLLAIFLVIVTLPLVSASTNTDAQQILVTAEQQASLFHDQTSAFQLDVDFIAQVNTPIPGHFTLKWESKDRWWRKIVMSDFQQTEIRNGERQYTSRNMGFTPLRIRELISMLQFTEGAEELVAKKQKERSENGIEMVCMRVEGESRGKGHEVCVDSASHDILSDQWQEPPDERRREQYSDYFDFKGHRYPRALKLLVNGNPVITATVNNLATIAFDQTLLVAPKGAIERRQCANLKHAVPIKTPNPVYPKSASQNKIMGDTTVQMTVLEDGSVSDIQLLGSAVHSIDDAALQALKGWKFKPAMCGADPVVSDLQVIVSFRLR